MHIRLTITLLGLLVPLFATGCGSSNSAPTTLSVSEYKTVSNVSDYTNSAYLLQHWQLSDATLVHTIYVQALALPIQYAYPKFIFPTWTRFTFTHDATVILQADTSISTGGLLLRDGKSHVITIAFVQLLQQGYCEANPATSTCVKSKS